MGGEKMDTKKRMQLIRIEEKIKENPEFGKKIGIVDKSYFKLEKEKIYGREK